MGSLFDDLLTITKNLTQQAEATGTVQTFQWGDDSVKPITKGGEVVGSYRIMGLEITVTPKSTVSKPKRRTNHTPRDTARRSKGGL